MNAKVIEDKLLKAAREDPKKVGVLVVLVALMLVLWVRAMAGREPGPAPAMASPVASGGTAGARGGSERSETGLGPSVALGLVQEWTRSPLAPVGRNLFQVNLDYFARDPSRLPIIAPETGVEGFWDQLAKSLAAQADQRKERRILVENLQRQAAGLKIQTIVMGEKPRALINGELVGEGDIAASFRVLRIEPRRVLVEREGVRMEILMH